MATPKKPQGKPVDLAEYLQRGIGDLTDDDPFMDHGMSGDAFLNPAVAADIEKTLDDMEWDEWNEAGEMTFVDFPPVVSAAKLEINKRYKIIAIRKVRTDAVSI